MGQRILTADKFNKKSTKLPLARGSAIPVNYNKGVDVMRTLYGESYIPFDLQQDLNRAYLQGEIPWRVCVGM